jgi:micrococcal nuclease
MYTYNATLDRVIDGDTVDLVIDLGFDITIKQTVRLNGINTPELHSTNPTEKAAAEKAKARLNELLTGQPLIVNTKKDSREKYGRLLAEIFINNTSVNQQMLTEGLGVAYSGGPRT